MNLLLSFLAAVTASINSIAIRLFEEKVQKNHRDLLAYQIAYIFLGGMVFFLFSGFSFPATTQGRLLTIVFGAALTMSSIGMAESYLCGPMSLSSVIISCNVVLPVLFGCLVFREVLSAFHLIGMALLLAMFILSGTGSNEAKREISLKWILMVMLAFLGEGLGAITLAAYGRLPETGDNKGFMAISFFAATVMLLVNMLISGRKGRKQQHPVHISVPFVLLAVWAAVGCFVTNLLVIYLAGVMPSSVLYPVYSGSVGILVTLISCVCFRERMSGKKAVMILLGIGAVVFLNL